MPTSMLMPSLSPTMEEGVLAKWLVKEGDMIRPGTMLCSVETDKTTVDYESLDEGYLRKILVPNGGAAKVNQLIAILTDDKDEDYSAFLEKALAKSQQGSAKKGVAEKAAPTESAATSPAIANESENRVKASPLAKKMAEASNLSLNQLSGSGPNGRIIKRDIENYQPKSAPSQEKTAPTAVRTEGPVQRPLYGSLAPIGQTQDLPLNMMRKTIGKRLLESYQNIPSFNVTIKVEMDALNGLRNQLNRSPGYKISVNDLIVKASSFALRQLPMVNASFMGDFIRQNSNIDICVAVSVEGGIVTPIIRNADQKGLGQVSSEIKQLVAKAKVGKLAPEEYQGGTFTISNLGMYGVEEFTAIINPPQSAILAVGGMHSELYKDGTEIKSRETMKLTLTADHRVIDGALAAQFLSGLKSIIENPVWMML